MRKIMSLILVLLIILLAGCAGAANQRQEQNVQSDTLKKVEAQTSIKVSQETSEAGNISTPTDNSTPSTNSDPKPLPVNATVESSGNNKDEKMVEISIDEVLVEIYDTPPCTAEELELLTPVDRYVIPQTYAGLKDNYYIGKYEVTYSLWQTVYQWATDEARGAGKYTLSVGQQGSTKAENTNEQHPVANISTMEAAIWCNALTEYYNVQNNAELECVYLYTNMEPIRDSKYRVTDFDQNMIVSETANGFRLPTHFEWIYAACILPGNKWNSVYNAVGDTSGFVTNERVGEVGYNIEEDPLRSVVYGDFGWHRDNSGMSTHPVGEKSPNTLGLYDMSGNVSDIAFEKEEYYYQLWYLGGSCWNSYGSLNCIPSNHFNEVQSKDGSAGFRLARNGY